jgi:hypothetical protein
MHSLEEQLRGACQTLERAHEMLLGPEPVNLIGSAKLLEEAEAQLSRLRDDVALTAPPRAHLHARLARRLRAIVVRNEQLTTHLGRSLNLLAKIHSTQSGYGDGAAIEEPARPHPPTISLVG